MVSLHEVSQTADEKNTPNHGNEVKRMQHMLFQCHIGAEFNKLTQKLFTEGNVPSFDLLFSL